MSKRPVVAAAIVDSLSTPTSLLCAARSYPTDVAGLFELPGGKIEDGESPQQALQREIREELSTTLTLGTEVKTSDASWWPIREGRLMGVWLAEIAPGAPTPQCGNSHQELRWVPFPEVHALAWLEHDKPIIDAAIASAERERIHHIVS